jgi:tetratricopeptide (TPR) repeat protein
MTHRRLVFAAALLSASCVQAQAQGTAQGTAPAKWADTLSREIETAQMAGDLVRLQAAVALADRIATAYPADGLIQHYRGYALYRMGTVQTGKNIDASAIYEKARSILDLSLKTHPLPETHMLLASIDGQLIAKDPSRGMELGMASQASSSTALSLGPNDPRVWLLRGQAAIFTPPEYGGGLKSAEGQLKHAIELFAKDAPRPGEPAWGKAEAYLWLGQVYAQSGDKVQAAEMYKQALSITPSYAYAKFLSAALK